MAVSGNGGVRVHVDWDADALTGSPTWNELGAYAGVRVSHVNIRRGRPNERDKTTVGTVTITGTDTGGTLDPTNTGSPLFVAGGTKVNPVRQARVQLWNPVTNTWWTIFRGWTSVWSFEVDYGKTRLAWTLELVDALDILNDAEVIPDQAGHMVPNEATGDVYYAPQQVDDRIRAAIADSATAFLGKAWPPSLLEIFTGNVAVQGVIYAARTPLLQVIEDAADAEFPGGVANFWVSRTGVLTFHGRLARFNPTDPTYKITHFKAGDEIAFAADANTAVLAAVGFDRSKDNLINAALATPKDVADADVAGQFVKDDTSVSKYAPRSVSFESLLTLYGDNPTGPPIDVLTATRQFSTYYVANYKSPHTRIAQLPFTTKHPDDARAPAIWNVLTSVDISDMFTVTTHHPGGGGFNEDYFVEGVTYDIEPMTGDFAHVVLTLDVSPRALYNTDPF